MSSSYFGEPNMAKERSGGSSRKGKKSSSDKPKQPQRGLGVAQLEKIRLHNQMGCGYIPSLQTPYPFTNLKQEDIRTQTANSSPSSAAAALSYTSPSSSSYSFYGAPSLMMGMSEPERAKISYGDSHPSSTARWTVDKTALDTQHYQQSGITRQLLNLDAEESVGKKKKKTQTDSMCSGSQNSGSSGSPEIDLELRLSL